MAFMHTLIQGVLSLFTPAAFRSVTGKFAGGCPGPLITFADNIIQTYYDY